MSEVKGQGHILYPVSNQCTSFSFHINQTNHSWALSPTALCLMKSVPSICERLGISSNFLAFHKLCNDGPFLVHIDATDGWHRRYCLSTWPLLTARFVTTIHCTQPPLWSLPNLSNSQVLSLGLGKLFPAQHGPWVHDNDPPQISATLVAFFNWSQPQLVKSAFTMQF